MGAGEGDTEKLVRTVLKLRAALSAALLGLSEVETLASLEETRSRAREARRAARAILAAGMDPVVESVRE